MLSPHHLKASIRALPTPTYLCGPPGCSPPRCLRAPNYSAPTCQAQGFRDIFPELPDAGSLPAVLGDGAVLYEVLGVSSLQEAI